MRQKDYAPGALRTCVRRLQNRVFGILLLTDEVEATIRFYTRLVKKRSELRRTMVRRRKMRMIHFKFNIFFTEEVLRLFYFGPHELRSVSNIMGFSGKPWPTSHLSRTFHSCLYCSPPYWVSLKMVGLRICLPITKESSFWNLLASFAWLKKIYESFTGTLL